MYYNLRRYYDSDYSNSISPESSFEEYNTPGNRALPASTLAILPSSPHPPFAPSSSSPEPLTLSPSINAALLTFSHRSEKRDKIFNALRAMNAIVPNFSATASVLDIGGFNLVVTHPAFKKQVIRIYFQSDISKAIDDIEYVATLKQSPISEHLLLGDVVCHSEVFSETPSSQKYFVQRMPKAEPMEFPPSLGILRQMIDVTYTVLDYYGNHNIQYADVKTSNLAIYHGKVVFIDNDIHRLTCGYPRFIHHRKYRHFTSVLDEMETYSGISIGSTFYAMCLAIVKYGQFAPESIYTSVYGKKFITETTDTSYVFKDTITNEILASVTIVGAPPKSDWCFVEQPDFYKYFMRALAFIASIRYIEEYYISRALIKKHNLSMDCLTHYDIEKYNEVEFSRDMNIAVSTFPPPAGHAYYTFTTPQKNSYMRSYLKRLSPIHGYDLYLSKSLCKFIRKSSLTKNSIDITNVFSCFPKKFSRQVKGGKTITYGPSVPPTSFTVECIYEDIATEIHNADPISW